ncbi:hypothetical protein Bca4012_027736 [Brassica carinata]
MMIRGDDDTRKTRETLLRFETRGLRRERKTWKRYISFYETPSNHPKRARRCSEKRREVKKMVMTPSPLTA